MSFTSKRSLGLVIFFFGISGKGLLAELQYSPNLSLGTCSSPTLLPSQCFMVCRPHGPFLSRFLLNSCCLWDPLPSTSCLKNMSGEGASDTFTQDTQQEKHMSKNTASQHDDSLPERTETSPVLKPMGRALWEMNLTSGEMPTAPE